ncbi:MAG TPA: hypothetical protein PLN94_07855 [Thiolinea sp.]|nr:hypothetical protein [Thiolinea sp.]
MNRMKHGLNGILMIMIEMVFFVATVIGDGEAPRRADDNMPHC